MSLPGDVVCGEDYDCCDDGGRAQVFRSGDEPSSAGIAGMTQARTVPSMVCWLVRAGEQSRYAKAFEDNLILAIGWPRVPGLQDLSGLDRSDVVGLLISAPHIGTPVADANELLAFRDTIEVGDLIVTPDTPRREVLLGEVTGPYTYRDPSPAIDYRHVREMRWLGRWDRHLLPEDLNRDTRYRRTIRRLDEHEQQWAEVFLRMRT
jgi:predicted Mrr-cat superfamily restriction endonuclease